MCAARACMGRAAGVRGVCRECAGRVRESMGRGCAGRVPGGVLGALGVCHARHPARRLPERAGVPGARAGCGVCGGVPCAGCVPGVCVCAGCVPVCSSGVCGLCGLCLSNDNVPGVCWPCWVWESMRIGRLVWGVPGVCRECAGLCRPSVLGVSGVFPECAGSACRMCAGRAWVVPRVCGVCRVPGVGRVRVCRVCAGVPVGGVWAVWLVLARHLAKACRERSVPGVCRLCWVCAGRACVESVLVWGVVRVCRVCAACVLPGVCWECAASVPGCAGQACWVCLGCAGSVPDVCWESMGRAAGARGCAVCRVCVGSVRVCWVCAGVCWSGCAGCAWCVPGVCRMCAGFVPDV